ncbi:MAG: PAS domain S-box protein, partial [Acidobacteria bacterium]|nr:PAS domain S-box protein [Acidobacteriota bacterium]
EANRTALDTAGVIESAVCDRRIWNTRWWAGLVEEQKRLEWAVAEAAAGNITRLELEAHGFGKRTLTLDLSLKPVINRKGKVVLLNAEARDISERKRAERELAERTAYLNALVENSPLGIVAHDAEGRVRLCNPAFERLFGHACKNIQGERLDALISSETYASEAAGITRQVVGGNSVQVTTRRQRRDGTLLDVRIYGVPLIVGGELLGGFGLYEDITEPKRAEEERERLVVELQEALANIKTLSGLLPICASCKKIRDDQGYWSQIESYISARSRAQFSHGICPECAQQLYPEHYHKMFPEFEKEKKD